MPGCGGRLFAVAATPSACLRSTAGAPLFSGQSQEWILKGGVSLIARLSVARHTADVDLVAVADTADAALTALHQSAARDLGDFFTFRFEPPRSLVQGVEGLRIPTEAWLGPRLFERFGVDLVTGVVITGRAEVAGPLLAFEIPGLVRPRYRLYPLVDSIADKVMAIMEVHNGRPSTRFRDLIDLVLIAHNHFIRADELTMALSSERFRRGLPVVLEFVVPDLTLWRKGYTGIADGVPGLHEKDLAGALGLVKDLVDPVLAGTVSRERWNPSDLAWRPEDREPSDAS